MNTENESMIDDSLLVGSNAPRFAFPASRKDVSNLKQVATDAAKDLKSTASVHADKARRHITDLAEHAKEEGGAQLEQLRKSVLELSNSARGYASDRPFIIIGAGLLIGLVIGLSLRRSAKKE